MKEKIKDILSYVLIIVVVILIRTYLITPGIVNGSSMESTLYDNEVVLINKWKLRYGINRFDIVVVSYEGSSLVKRVIGLPNETITYKDNKLYVNMKEIVYDYDFEYTEDFELTSGDNEYIVLGDNRDVSKDSRMIGAIKEEDIKGIVNIRIFPFNKIGKVK